jgi:hypothetical protein
MSFQTIGGSSLQIVTLGIASMMDDSIQAMVDYLDDGDNSVGEIMAYMKVETARMQQLQNLMDGIKKALENSNAR